MATPLINIHARSGQPQSSQRQAKPEGLLKRLTRTMGQMLGVDSGPLLKSASRSGAYYLSKADIKVASVNGLSQVVHGRKSAAGCLPPDHQLNDFLTGIVEGRIQVS